MYFIYYVILYSQFMKPDVCSHVANVFNVMYRAIKNVKLS